MPRKKSEETKEKAAKKKPIAKKKASAKEKAAVRKKPAKEKVDSVQSGSVGNRYEVTPELIKKIETLAAQGLTQEQICSCIGWSRDTLWRKKKLHSDMADAIKKGKDKGLAVITNALFEKAKKGDTVAQIFYLKNRSPDEWKDRRDNTFTGANGGPIKFSEIKLTGKDG
jgi:hypothetical protein